jgi:hypothetical protein
MEGGIRAAGPNRYPKDWKLPTKDLESWTSPIIKVATKIIIKSKWVPNLAKITILRLLFHSEKTRNTKLKTLNTFVHLISYILFFVFLGLFFKVCFIIHNCYRNYQRLLNDLEITK